MAARRNVPGGARLAAGVAVHDRSQSSDRPSPRRARPPPRGGAHGDPGARGVPVRSLGRGRVRADRARGAPCAGGAAGRAAPDHRAGLFRRLFAERDRGHHGGAAGDGEGPRADGHGKAAGRPHRPQGVAMAEAMNCFEAEGHLALASVGALEGADRSDLERHLATCHACRGLAARNADAVSLLFGALDPVAPPPRLRRNLMAQVYAEAVGGPGAVRRSRWRHFLDRIPASRALSIAGAGALAAAVALLVWENTGGRPAVAPHEVSYRVMGTTADPSASGTLTFDPAQSIAEL